MATLKQIRYFVAVAEAGSIRQAAELSGVSQPTMSVQISSLERYLDVKLLERSRTATRLTPAGRELLPSARDLVSQAHQFEELAHSLGDTQATTHRLGVPPTLGPYLLPTIMPALHRRFERLKLYVREDVPRDLEVGVLDGKHDFILAPLPLTAEGLAVEVLFREPLWLVAPGEMGLKKRDTIGEGDLAGMEILNLDARHHLHTEVQQICERTGAKLKRDYEGTSLDTLRQMVVMGMGLAFLPALYVQSELHRPEELDVIKMTGGRLYREHALAFRPTSPSRNFYRAVAALIRELVADEFKDIVSPIYDRSA